MRAMMTVLGSVSALAMAACSPAESANETPVAAPVGSTDEVRAQEGATAPVPTIERLVPEFQRTAPSTGAIGYSREGDVVTLTFVVGGNPNGAATAADCMLQIKGPQGQDDVVRGNVVPSVTSLGEVTQDDIGSDPIKVDVMIGPEGAMVTDHGAARKLCAMGVQLDGFYKRISAPE